MARSVSGVRNLKNTFARLGLSGLYRPCLIVCAVIMMVAMAILLIRFWPSSATDAADGGEGIVLQDADSSSVKASDTDTATSSDATLSDANTADDTQTALFVDVAGAVNAPGVYELADGSRVIDAVSSAGGVTDEAYTGTTNLARKLADGEQIYIPTEQEVSSGATPSSAAGTKSSSGDTGGAETTVNINTADAETLTTLPGIGEVMAKRIVDDREENGPFTNVDDIMRVSGIGEKTFESIRDSICV